MRLLAAIVFVIGLVAARPALADKAADAHYKEGLAYKLEGKVDKAIESLEQAVAKNPKHGMAWASLGSLYKQNKDLPKSITAYENASKIITKDKTIWRNLGLAYANSDPPRFEDAKAALLTACRLDPKDAEIRAHLGTVRRKLNDNAGAIVDLEIATKLKPDEGEYWHSLGVAYRHSKRDDDAIKAYEKAIEINPNEARYHFDAGAAWRRKDDPDKAIPHYEKATSLDPTYADGWFDLGFMYKRNKENDKAIHAWKMYLDLNCKLKDADARKRIGEEMTSIGGKAGECKKDGGTPKKPAPKKK